MGVIKAAAGDAILTFMWVFALPVLGILTKIAIAALGVQPMSVVALFVSTILATLNVMMFGIIGNFLGGASFNPATSVSFYAAGVKPDSSLTSMAIRFPVQAFAGVAGAMGILQAVPFRYKNTLKGPHLKVDLHTGAIAEGLMNFVLNLAILVIFVKGPRRMLAKVWLLAATTVGLVVAGARYTGPALNPANAFGWAYVNNWHNTWEHFYVYWVCPFIGAILAGWVFQVLFPVPKKKQKKA